MKSIQTFTGKCFYLLLGAWSLTQRGNGFKLTNRINTRSFITNRLLPSGMSQQHYQRLQSLQMSSIPPGGGSGDVNNPMNPNIYTEKAFESISKLPQYGDKYQQQVIEAPILLKSLIDEGPGGITQRILAKANVDITKIDKDLEAYIKNQPRVSDTSTKSLGRSMIELLTKAGQIKTEFGDSYIAVEHLLLASIEINGYTKKVFNDNGYRYNQIKDAAMAIRGTTKVTSRNAEAQYEALKLYSRDLTAAAAEGKLDPVIGRDEEIRRTIQILSRRTKNNPILLGEPGL